MLVRSEVVVALQLLDLDVSVLGLGLASPAFLSRVHLARARAYRYDFELQKALVFSIMAFGMDGNNMEVRNPCAF